MDKKRTHAVISAAGRGTVIFVGVFFGGWSMATTMVLYIFETLVSIILAPLRLMLRSPKWEDLPGERPRDRRDMIKWFLITASGYWFGEAVFTAFALPSDLPPIPRHDLMNGAIGILLFELLNFAMDVGAGPLSLREGENVLGVPLGRIALLLVAIFLGLLLRLFSEWWFLYPFVVLKTFVELATPFATPDPGAVERLRESTRSRSSTRLP